jgi:hypothetical protein
MEIRLNAPLDRQPHSLALQCVRLASINPIIVSQRMDKSIMSSYRDNPEIKNIMNHEMSASFTSRNVVAEATGKKMVTAVSSNNKAGASECLNCNHGMMFIKYIGT